MTLREEKPAADSCGHPFLDKQIEGFLPVGCGAEAVFNFSWEKEIIPYGSGNDNDDGDDDFDFMSPVTTAGATVIPTRSLLSTETRPHTLETTKSMNVPHRPTSRLPSRFTPSAEDRHLSFHHLLRLHLNTFNQRLSMLESNTLDMKESIRQMQDHQGHLSSQLMELISMHSAPEKNKKVNELEKGYTDMESRLSRLEGRLEILIDGFTALAQEMNKMKRTRHVSHSPKERRFLPLLTTVLPPPKYSVPEPPTQLKPTETPPTIKATVPKSIPTPNLPVNRPVSSSHRDRHRKLKVVATTKPKKITSNFKSATRSPKREVSTSSTKTFTTTLSKPKLVANITPKNRLRSVSPPKSKKPKQVKDEPAITKFQVEPPAHKLNPARGPQLHKQSDQAAGKGSSLPVKTNVHKKVLRSDSSHENGNPSDVKLKSFPKPHRGNSQQNEKKLGRNSVNTRGKNPTATTPTTTMKSTKKTKSTTTKKPIKTTAKTTSPTKTKVSTPKKKFTTTKAKPTPSPTKNKASTPKKKYTTSTTTVKPTTSPTKNKASTAKKKYTTSTTTTTTIKRTSTHSKTKGTTAKKVTKKPFQKKKTNSHSGVLDLLRLLKGDQNSGKHKKSQDGSLHVVLGRLAIPIKIIPDD